MPLVVMVVGPIVEAVFASLFLVAAVMLPLSCMAAADSMVTSARCRQRLAGKDGTRSTCCFDAAGYDSSDEEGGVAGDSEAEEAAAEPQRRPSEGGSPPQKASSAAEGLRRRAATVGSSPSCEDLEDVPPSSRPPERALST